MKRKQTLTGKDNYPRYFDLFESVIDNKKDLKEHMKIHSYKKANYQRVEFNFLGDIQRTTEVHIGKHHSELLKSCY